MAHLTQEQRYTIERLKQNNFKQIEIAKIIGKSRSVICRELKRNCDKRSGQYRADLAQRKCAERHKQKNKNSFFNQEVEQYVRSLIQEDYSPEQIIGLSKKNGVKCVSHERIYQYVWKEKKEGGMLYKHLRNQGKRYRKRGAKKDKRGMIPNRRDIDLRPKIVEDKSRFGDLEIDLIIGKNHKQAILTINDRATGVLKMGKLKSKNAKEVSEKAYELLREWKPMIKTITADNGKEFAKHEEISQKLNVDFFFAKPYHSWERGANENLNGLVRQYFPKGYDFNLITDQEIKRIENKINNRPRKRFGYLTPNQVYLQLIKRDENVAFIT